MASESRNLLEFFFLSLISVILRAMSNEHMCSHNASLGPCLNRYRSGGGKSQNQLTVNELRQFVTQLYALPCVLSQTPLLKVTI